MPTPLSQVIDELNNNLNAVYQAGAFRLGKSDMKSFDRKAKVASLYNVQQLGGPTRCAEMLDSDVLLGIEVEIENWCGTKVPGWINKPDNSLRNKGQEFVAGPMLPASVPERLRDLLAVAKESKWVANARTGIHVHMNFSNKPFDFLLTFAACYLAVERCLFRYAGEWRRWCNFCHPLEEAEEPLLFLRNLMSHEDYRPRDVVGLGKYAGLNFTSLAQYGTLEVRILPTTFEYAQLIGWINALLSIYATAESLYEEGTSVPDYVKAFGTETLLARLLFQHPVSREEFQPVASVQDIRAALPRIRWLMTMAKTDWQIDYDVSKLLASKDAPGNTDVEYICSAKVTSRDFNKYNKVLTDLLLSGSVDVHVWAAGTARRSSKELIAAMRQNNPKFTTAFEAALLKEGV